MKLHEFWILNSWFLFKTKATATTKIKASKNMKRAEKSGFLCLWIYKILHSCGCFESKQNVQKQSEIINKKYNNNNNEIILIKAKRNFMRKSLLPFSTLSVCAFVSVWDCESICTCLFMNDCLFQHGMCTLCMDNKNKLFYFIKLIRKTIYKQ